VSDPAVTVDGDSPCPSPAAVAARLPSLMRATVTTPAGPARRARVDARDGAIHLSLVDERGRLIAARTLAGGSACTDLAQASAVILATWLATIAPGDVPTVVAPPSPRPEMRAPAAEVRTFADLDVGVGAGAQLAFAQAAWAAALRVQMIGALASGLGFLVGGQLSGQRSIAIDGGAAQWRRSTIDIGAAYVKPAGHWQLGVSAGAQAGWLSAEGSGFPIVHGGTRWSPGVFGLARLARPFGRVAPWLALGVCLPVIESQLVIVGTTQSRDFRPLELQLSVGVAFGRFQ